jgi:L-ascorbate metabolism protein UlaG (beta-lactamase superfamily)
MPADIKWLGHASFRLSDGKTIVYIDPYQVSQPETADVILITHEHFDHCSPDDVMRLAGADTVIVAPPDCKIKLAGIDGKFVPALPNQKLQAAGLDVKTLPAYNLNKQFHPKARNWLGYIVSIGGEKVYHAGDTDAIPEMSGLEIDVALLPVGGTYTMTAEEAAAAFKKMKAKRAVPMHYGSIVGKKDDADRFNKSIAKK